MPAAMVIPAPIAYINVVAVKKLVVGSRAMAGGCAVCCVNLPVFPASLCRHAGEILGSPQDEQRRKHLQRMFSLIKNESNWFEDDQIPS